MKSIHREEYLRFLKRLRTHRKSAKVSQAEVAEKLERPQSFVSKVESGERRLDLLEFIEWARAIQMNAGEAVQGFADDLEANELRGRRRRRVRVTEKT